MGTGGVRSFLGRLKSDTTTHADGTQSTKPKSDGALLATHVPFGEVSSSAQAELAASCERRARFGLSHTRTPLSPLVCLRAARKALTEDAASGRRKPLSRYSRLSMALSQRFRGNFVSPLKLQFLTHLFPGCCRRGLQWDEFMTLLPQKCVRLIHPTYKKLTKNNNYEERGGNGCTSLQILRLTSWRSVRFFLRLNIIRFPCSILLVWSLLK